MKRKLRFWWFEIFGLFLPAIAPHVVAVLIMYVATIALLMP